MAAIIFDFDGTIADSFDYVSNFLAEQAGVAPLSREQKQQLRGLSVAGMVRRLGYHWWHAPNLFFKGRWQMTHAIKHLQAFEGMPEVIRKLHAEGHELFILSTNSVRNVHRFLHGQKLHTYFLEIYGGVGMFGKAPALRRLLREQNINLKDAIYIGDELRDIQSAQSINLRVIAVNWGFARMSSLKAAGATALADSPEKIISILEEL
jgi:phosphoglycolate phosphatase